MARPIFLLTDFGTRDAFAGQVRAAIAAVSPGSAVHDLTHEVEPFAIDEGAWLLETSLAVLPRDAVVLAVVDPGVGTARRAIVAEAGGRAFVAPDNGLLTAVLAPCGDGAAPATVHEIARLPGVLDAVGQPEAAKRATGPSSTFHGRDLFAPAAALLALGVSPADIGPVVTDPVLLPPFAGEPGPRGVLRGRVVHIDRYGNAITTVRAEQLPPAFEVEAAGKRIDRSSRTFGEIAPGDAAAYIDSSGFLALAVFRGDAAALLGLKRGTPVEVVPR